MSTTHAPHCHSIVDDDDWNGATRLNYQATYSEAPRCTCGAARAMSTFDLLVEAAERSEDVRVLTLREPYASLIAWGVKTIETRPRGTSHRGLLAIHSGVGADIECAAQYVDALWSAMGCADRPLGQVHVDKGHVLAVVQVLDVRDLRPEDEPAACFYAPGRKAWILGPDVVRVFPNAIPFKGCQGLGRISAELLHSKVRRELAA